MVMPAGLAGAAAICIWLVACGTATTGDGVASSDEVTTTSAHVANAVIERVVDGDTLVATIGGRSERVRLLGIDTPESVAPNRPVECFGAEASRYLGDLIPADTPVRLVLDAEARDQYDRLLAYAFRSTDGLFVNLAMLRDGYADILVIEPNAAYADVFAEAVSAARAGEIGLWGACGGADLPLDPQPP